MPAGTLAEVLGPNLVETDRESRRLRLRRIAEDAYADSAGRGPRRLRGLHARRQRFIATHLNQLPVEFTLLGYQPRPWSTIDCLLLCLHMYRSLTTTWKDEIVKNNLIAQGDRAKVDYLYSMRGIGDVSPGSNAWALAGSRTASGKPLLSNDMHLEYSLPGIWYMAHLEAPGFNVAGVRCPARRASSWATTTASPGASPIFTSTCRICTSRRSTTAPGATSSAGKSCRRAPSAKSSE